MALSRRSWFLAALLPLLVLAACGDESVNDDGVDGAPSFGDITVTAINFDGTPGPGCSVGLPGPFPTTPVEIAISGIDFPQLSGQGVVVRWYASSSPAVYTPGPTPFSAGTAGTVDTVGTVFSSTLVCGDSPHVQICGDTNGDGVVDAADLTVFAFIEVILPSGVRDDSTAGPTFVATFSAPIITSLCPNNCIPSMTPIVAEIYGNFFGAVGDVVTVRFRSTENGGLGDPIFNDGTTTTTDVVGTVEDAPVVLPPCAAPGSMQRITILTPKSTNQVEENPGSSLYNVSDPFEEADVQLILANGSCSQPGGASDVFFDRPEANLAVSLSDAYPAPVPPSTQTFAPQQFHTQIVLTGFDDTGPTCADRFGPPGARVQVLLAAPGGPAFAPSNAFQLTNDPDPKAVVGTENFEIVEGEVISPFEIRFETPLIDAIDAPFNFRPVITVQFEDGTIIPVELRPLQNDSIFVWQARPFVSGVQIANVPTPPSGYLDGIPNLSNDFHGSVTRTNILQVLGDNFDTLADFDPARGALVFVYGAEAGLDGANQPVEPMGTGNPAPNLLIGGDLGDPITILPTNIEGTPRLEPRLAELDDADATPGDGRVLYGVRVQNEDGQFRDFCPPGQNYLTGEFDDAGNLYPDFNATDGDADTNNNPSIAIDPTSIPDDFANPPGTESVPEIGMNVMMTSENDATNAGYFETVDFDVRFSRDGGTTWSTAAGVGAALDGSGDPDVTRTFPMVRFDRFGNGWLTYLLNEPNLDQCRVAMALTVNQGATWFLREFFSLPGGVTAPFGTLDRPCLATGPAQAGGDEAVYVAYTDIATSQVLVGAHSVSISGFNGAGALVPVNAQPEVVSTTAALPDHARCAVGPSGELHVVWVDRTAFFTADILANRDQDGLYAGAFTWTPFDSFVDFAISIVAAPHAASPDAGPPVPLPSIAVVPTGTHSGRVVVAYDQIVPNFLGGGSDHLRVTVAVSDDEGFTWDDDITVHQTDPSDQFLPAICADRVTGRLYITWTDTVGDATHTATNRFSAASDDGYQWGDRIRLSDTPSVADGEFFEITDYGVTMDVAAHGGHVVGAWAGNEAAAGAGVRMDAFTKVYQQTATSSP
jgi:hypothetical protein